METPEGSIFFLQEWIESFKYNTLHIINW
jgi:hypothetical protein